MDPVPLSVRVQVVGEPTQTWEMAVREISDTRICLSGEFAPPPGTLVRLDFPNAMALGEVIEADRTAAPPVLWIAVRHAVREQP